MAVLSSLCPVLAVCCSLVSLVVDLSAEGVGELLCGTAALLAQVVAFSEVLAQVLVITVNSRVENTLKKQTSYYKNCFLHMWLSHL